MIRENPSAGEARPRAEARQAEAREARERRDSQPRKEREAEEPRDRVHLGEREDEDGNWLMPGHLMRAWGPADTAATAEARPAEPQQEREESPAPPPSRSPEPQEVRGGPAGEVRRGPDSFQSHRELWKSYWAGGGPDRVQLSEAAAREGGPVPSPEGQAAAPGTASTGTAPPGPGTTTPGPALTEEEARRVGTAWADGQKPPQTLWNEHAINVTHERGREQGGLTQEQMDANNALAKNALDPEGKLGPNAQPQDVSAARLAALVRDSGVALERQDPAQLAQASRYINEGATLGEQQERLRKTLGTFGILDRTGMPKLSGQEAKDLLWGAAKVPGHAFDKVDPNKAFQDLAGGINSGQGGEFKYGSHKVTLQANPDGTATSTTKKEGFWSKVGGIVKKALPVAAMVANFVPGIGTLASIGLRVASGLVSTVDAVKNGSVLGAVAAFGSTLSAGIGGMAARAASKGAEFGSEALRTVGRVAGGVATAARGWAARQSGALGLLGAAGSLVGGAAQALSNGSEGLADGLGRWGQRMSDTANRIGAAQNLRSTGRELDLAEKALSAARASGDPAAVAAAQHRLDEARKAKDNALLGGLAVGVGIAADNVTNEGVARGLEHTATGLNVARDVRRGDLLAAGTGVFGAVASESGNQDVRDAGKAAGELDAYRQSLQAEGRARKGVDEAERALQAARASGNPEAVAEAEKYLEQARKGQSAASLDRYFAGDQAARTGQDVGLRLEQERRVKAFEQNLQAVSPTLETATATRDGLAALAENPRARGGFQDLAQEALGRLDAAGNELRDALVSGDKKRIEEARVTLDKARAYADERSKLLEAAFRPAELSAPGLATTLDLSAFPRTEAAAAPPAAPADGKAPAPKAPAPRPAATPPSAQPAAAGAKPAPGMMGVPHSYWDAGVDAPQDPARPFAPYETPPALGGPEGVGVDEWNRWYEDHGQEVRKWNEELKRDPQYQERSYQLMRYFGDPQAALNAVIDARGGETPAWTRLKNWATGGAAAEEARKLQAQQSAQAQLRSIYGRDLTPYELRNMDHFLNNYAGMSAVKPEANDAWYETAWKWPTRQFLEGDYRVQTVGYTKAKELLGGGVPILYPRNASTGAPDGLDWTSGLAGIDQFNRDLEHFRRTGQWVYGSGWNPGGRP